MNKVAQTLRPETSGFLPVFLSVFIFFVMTQAGMPREKSGLKPVLLDEISHEITVHHPGMKENKPCKLIEKQDENGNSESYFMDVQSVICLDGKCKIVDVRLVWDRFGAYQKYELAKGVELEKKDGLAFTEADYEKLQTILLDKNSLFEEFELGEVVDIKKDDGGLDGISGATVLTDKEASVEGAAWTCYTLWHWANGEIVDVIKGITGKSASVDELYRFIENEDNRYVAAALKAFAQRKMYDEMTLELVKNKIDNLNHELTKTAITYFENAESTIYYPTIETLFAKSNDKQRLLFLESLIHSKENLSGSLLKIITPYFIHLENYQEVNLIIKFLENQAISDNDINQALIPFLEAEDFLIARRVYWFLSEQDLNGKQEKKVKRFERKNRGNL